MSTSQAQNLADRLAADDELRPRIAAAHRVVLDDAELGHDELTDEELIAVVAAGTIAAAGVSTDNIGMVR
ncbi:MAG: hypothetical protein AAGF73_12690 [Actinomycetota bacterium]